VILFVALLQLKPPVRTISKRPLSPLILAIPSTAQKAILDSMSVHKLEKSQETWSNHSTWQLISGGGDVGGGCVKRIIQCINIESVGVKCITI
jgi:hypothetical protein